MACRTTGHNQLQTKAEEQSMQLHVALAYCQVRTLLLGPSRGVLLIFLLAVSAGPPNLLLTGINLQRVLWAQSTAPLYRTNTCLIVCCE